MFTSDLDTDLYNGTKRDFLREFWNEPVEKYKLTKWANMGETKDLIVPST